jgi:hypothetical protein
MFVVDAGVKCSHRVQYLPVTPGSQTVSDPVDNATITSGSQFFRPVHYFILTSCNQTLLILSNIPPLTSGNQIVTHKFTLSTLSYLQDLLFVS